jgi:hypothetical protein
MLVVMVCICMCSYIKICNKYLCTVILFNYVACMGMIMFLVKRIAHPKLRMELTNVQLHYIYLCWGGCLNFSAWVMQNLSII